MNTDDIKTPPPGGPDEKGGGDGNNPPVGDLSEFDKLLVEWLNNPPERTRPSVVLPMPPYLDRTTLDRERFEIRARPKITKDSLKSIIRGGGDLIRDCLMSTNTGMMWVPANPNMLSGFNDGEIEVPIDVEEPSWWPGRDKPGGGGNGDERGEDESDLVYMPISYEEFIEMLQLLFDLPWLKKSAEDKMLVQTYKMRGIRRSGPAVRLDRRATAVARIQRYHATVNARPEDFPNYDPDEIPDTEEFPFHQVDLRYKRVDEKWDPDSKAVVFDELDTSGSMGGEPLAIAKFFFLLNLLWLRTRYNQVAVVLIAHNAMPVRVRSEAEFFRTDVAGGTTFWTAHEMVYNIAMAEFQGPDWNKYCLHATDGFGEHESYIIPWIEKLIRSGFNYFGYLEINPYAGWGGFWMNFEPSGMRAAKGVSSDCKPYVGYARVSTIDEVPEAMAQIFTMDRSLTAAA